MSDQQKWAFFENGPRSKYGYIRDQRGIVVAESVPINIGRTFVASVNACNGLTPEALESGCVASLVEAASEARDFLEKVHKKEPWPYSADGAVNILAVALYPFRADADPGVLGVHAAKANNRRPVIEPTPYHSPERTR